MSVLRAPLLLPFLLGLGCSPEYALLETVGGGGTEPAGGTGSGAGVGGYTGAGGFGVLPTGATCDSHRQCVYGNLCSNYRCTACSDVADQCGAPCDHGFQRFSVNRNGCAVCECSPPSECSEDAECGGGLVCYAGAHCQDGCSEPSCCFGNQCSLAGCGAAPAACLDFGCSDGGQCLASCDATSCECDGSNWLCESTTGGVAVASCPQACAAP